ncbi:MAG: hypothetical protein KJ645_08230, partial [Planctomycetes bacterium]|nr:hypothetical protein [Planctomycetota bacterium]
RLDHPERNHRAYYSFEIDEQAPGIVLDTNGGWDEKTNQCCSYYNGSDHYRSPSLGNPDDWMHLITALHEDQLDWLKAIISKHSKKALLLFGHHCLSPYQVVTPKFNGNGFVFLVRNPNEFHAALKYHSNPAKIAVFSGHFHPGYFTGVYDKIRHYNIRGSILGTTDPAYDGDGAGAWRHRITGRLGKTPTGENPFGENGVPHHNSYLTVKVKVFDDRMDLAFDHYRNPTFHYYDETFFPPGNPPQSLPPEDGRVPEFV